MLRSWRMFPVALLSAMAMVFAVNGYMVWTAVRSFPGEAGADGFDLSNDYGRVLESAERQAQLGWQVRITVDAAGRPALRLVGRDNVPLPTAAIDGTAERPVGPKETTALRFVGTGGGQYSADAALARGQWDVLLTVAADDRRLTTTLRTVVP